MSGDTIQRERRKHRRFAVREGAFVSTKDHHCLVGQIMDISLGGMCFKYIANGTGPSSCDLDIFLSNRRFYLKNIRYEMVSNTPMYSDVKLSFIPVCRCGVKFVNLTETQKSCLLHLIERYTLP